MYRLLVLLACLLVGIPPLEAQPIPGQVIVEWEDPSVLDDWNAARAPEGRLVLLKSLAPAFSIDLLQIEPPPANPEAWMKAFRQTPGVAAAQWDYLLEFHTQPNDPLYSQQWSLPRIGADLAWERNTSGLTYLGDTIVVAVLDGGFDLQHPDLAPNIWTNRGEIPGDGIDNDGNGYIDDYQGWNFAEDSPFHPVDFHGTAVAGIIGAAGNNGQGVAGVNWNLKMMLFTTKLVSHVVAAYGYVIDQRQLYKTFVVATNASFGLSGVFCKDQPIWGSMYDRLGKVGILTAAAVSNTPVDVEIAGDMPATCLSPFLLSVLNTDQSDGKEATSAYGAWSVDLGAPGAGIMTTRPNNQYGFFNGTSAATPHVTGAIALLYGLPCLEFGISAQKAPEQTALSVKDAIMEGLRPSAALQGLTVGGGRLDVFNSMQILEAQCGVVEPRLLRILRLYPNPASEGVLIEYEAHDQKRVSYQLINPLGQTILQGALPTSPWPDKQFYLPLPDLPKGLYHFAISDGQRQDGRSIFLY